MSEGDVKITAWMPETDQHINAVLSKLGEEANELAGRACRCIAQGPDGIDPESGRTNRAELSREVSDVMACMAMLVEYLDVRPDDDRIAKKYSGYQEWHRLIEASA